ncbi:MAG TPA: glycosyltransferase family 4 protein [Verrucomicrobiae bacterium]|nr:glycosyltransferase family 4 protein [Verrucomicrobiae bacterium]
MRIGIVGPSDERVPPVRYGGTEVQVSNLAEGLVEEGHDVTLFASGDSETSATLHATTPHAVRVLPEAADFDTRRRLNRTALKAGLRHIRDNQDAFDVIHTHTFPPELVIRASRIMNLTIPLVCTPHSRLDLSMYKRLQQNYPDAPFVSISNAQREPAPDLNYIATVYNGIKIPEYEVNESPGEDLLFVGRMCPEKDPLSAIEIAKKTGRRLIMAAKVDPINRDYFETEVEPAIDSSKDIEYIGEITPAERDELLRDAYALVAPINWPEAFGMFVAEAMAAGVPVVGRRRGALPELINEDEEKRTGYLGETVDEMANYVEKVEGLDRQGCRDHVELNFTAKKMVQGYISVYRQLLSQTA